MKKLFTSILAICLLSLLALSCSGAGSTPPVSDTEVSKALGAYYLGYESGSSAISTTGAVNVPTSFGPVGIGNGVTYTGTYTKHAGNSMDMTVTATFNNYFDASSGYTISGSLTVTVLVSAAMDMNMHFVGGLNFTGGPVSTFTMDMTMDMPSGSMTPTMTGGFAVNGHSYNASGFAI